MEGQRRSLQTDHFFPHPKAYCPIQGTGVQVRYEGAFLTSYPLKD